MRTLIYSLRLKENKRPLQDVPGGAFCNLTPMGKVILGDIAKFERKKSWKALWPEDEGGQGWQPRSPGHQATLLKMERGEADL
jgi:hypothetical protein